MIDSEDFINAVRRSFLPQLHFLLRGTFGWYAISHTTADEYVLTAHCSEETIETVLERLGFSRNPIAALKVRTDGNTSEGSWVWRPSPLADDQLHVVIHDLRNEPGVDVYATGSTRGSATPTDTTSREGTTPRRASRSLAGG